MLIPENSYMPEESTYGQKLERGGWETVDEILRLAEQDFNERDPVGFEIDLELIGDESTAVEGDSRLYEIQGVYEDYDNTVEVSRVGDDKLKISSYSLCDNVFHEYGKSLGSVMSIPTDKRS